MERTRGTSAAPASSARNAIDSLVCVLGGHKPPNLHKWGPGIRDVYALHYIIKGKGTYQAKGNEFALAANESFIIFPQTEVCYYPDPDDPWEYVWIEFKGDDAESLVSLTSLRPDHPVTGKAPANLLPLFAIIENANVKPFERMRSTARLRLLMSYYAEYFPARAMVHPPDYVWAAKEYIAHNYWRESLTVMDITRFVSVERSYLYRLFKEKTGMSVSAYVTSFRMGRACELLRTSGLSVKSVACSVGYPDQLYFSKVFKKTTSFTPSEYKAMAAEGAAPVGELAK